MGGGGGGAYFHVSKTALSLLSTPVALLSFSSTVLTLFIRTTIQSCDSARLEIAYRQ